MTAEIIPIDDELMKRSQLNLNMHTKDGYKQSRGRERIWYKKKNQDLVISLHHQLNLISYHKQPWNGTGRGSNVDDIDKFKYHPFLLSFEKVNRAIFIGTQMHFNISFCKCWYHTLLNSWCIIRQ